MGGDNFDKANSDSDSLLNALNKAQNQRDSIEKRLKRQLQAKLEVAAAEYVNTLALEEKIAKAAIKGSTSITLQLKHHENATLRTVAFIESNTTTGLTFSKSWYDFYDHIQAVYKNKKIKIIMEYKPTPGYTGPNRQVFMKIVWQ